MPHAANAFNLATEQSSFSLSLSLSPSRSLSPTLSLVLSIHCLLCLILARLAVRHFVYSICHLHCILLCVHLIAMAATQTNEWKMAAKGKNRSKSGINRPCTVFRVSSFTLHNIFLCPLSSIHFSLSLSVCLLACSLLA